MAFPLNPSDLNKVVVNGIKYVYYASIPGWRRDFNNALNQLFLVGYNQSVSTSTGDLVTYGGIGIGGNATIGGTLSVYNTATFYYQITGTITTATDSSHLKGGTAGALVYQTGTNRTGFITIGPAGSIMQSNGVIPVWTASAAISVATAITATNISSGLVGQIPYQSAQGITAFSPNFTFDTTKLSVATGTASTSTTNGALVVTGGVGISGDLYVGGAIRGTFTFANSGTTSAYATKRVLQYNESTKEITYSNTLDAVRPYITGYSSEIHVSPVAADDTGNGTIGDPVKTIARAKVLAALAFETTAVGQRKTIILHPGDYSENVTIDTQYTVLTTHELVGKSTTLSGTLTITKGCTIDGLKITNLIISAGLANGSVDIIGCTVTAAVTKTSTAYTTFRGCDLSSATLSITGSGSTILVGGNYFTLAVNNASAAVLAKAVITLGPVTLTAGTLQLSDTLIYAATSTSNAVTQSAGSVLTLNNCQTLLPTLDNVARNSFGGYYSILHSVYDKANSTFGGVSLNSISYSQYINADRLTVASATASTNTLTGALIVTGGVGIGGNLNVGGQISGTITLALTATTATTAYFATTSSYAYTATTSTNISGGSTGQIPYQTSLGQTSFSAGFTYNSGSLINSIAVTSTLPAAIFGLNLTNSLNDQSPAIKLAGSGNGIALLSSFGTLRISSDISLASALMTIGSTQVNIPLTTSASSSISGALVVAGGVGIAKDLYVAGTIYQGSVAVTTLTTVPASSTSTGIVGQLASDGTYTYICYATNTWRRWANSTF